MAIHTRDKKQGLEEKAVKEKKEDKKQDSEDKSDKEKRDDKKHDSEDKTDEEKKEDKKQDSEDKADEEKKEDKKQDSEDMSDSEKKEEKKTDSVEDKEDKKSEDTDQEAEKAGGVTDEEVKNSKDSEKNQEVKDPESKKPEVEDQEDKDLEGKDLEGRDPEGKAEDQKPESEDSSPDSPEPVETESRDGRSSIENNNDLLEIQTEDTGKERGPEITEFYAKEEHIYTKESGKWYAAYDAGRKKSHVTFFVAVSPADSGVNDRSASPAHPLNVVLEAENGSGKQELKAKAVKAAGSEELYTVDFCQEGTWTFSALATDSGKIVARKKLKTSSSHDDVKIVVSSSRPEIKVAYDGEPCKEKGEGDRIYYGKSQSALLVTVTDDLASFDTEGRNQPDRPDMAWDSPSGIDLEAEKKVVNTSDTEYSTSYSLDREGDYSFELSWRSKNGRKPEVTEYYPSGMQNTQVTECFKSKEMIVDHTPPKLLSMTVDEGNNERIRVEDSDYIFLKNDSREKAYVTCAFKEDHLDGSSVLLYGEDCEVRLPAKVTRDKDGNCICSASVDISAWAREKEGRYRLSLGKMKDLAGNTYEAGAASDSGSSGKDAPGKKGPDSAALGRKSSGTNISGKKASGKKTSDSVINGTKTSGKKASGEESPEDSVWFVVDRTGPVLTVSFPAPRRVITDSCRLGNKGTELFYEEHQNIRLELMDDNDLSGIGRKKIMVSAASKATDEAEEYVSIPAGAEIPDPSVSTDGKDGDNWEYEITGLPDEESHSYFTVAFEDPSGNPVRVVTRIEGYGEIEDSGNEGDENDSGSGIYISPVITIDRTDPVITTSFKDSPSGTLGSRRFFQKPQTMIITVTDENFSCRDQDAEMFTVRYSASDHDPATKDPKEESLKADWLDGESWDQGVYRNGKKQYTAQVKLGGDWNYTVDVDAADLAGHRAPARKDQITVDTGSPYILVEDMENTPDSHVSFRDSLGISRVTFYDYARYGYFHKGSIRVRISACDDVAGIAAIKYRVTHEDGRIIRGEWTFKGQSAKQTRDLIIPCDMKAVISLVPVDHGGLSGNRVDPRGGVTESEKWHKQHSKTEIRILGKPSGTADHISYYNTSVAADIILEDSHSGIGRYSYQAGKTLSGRQDYREDAGTRDRRGKPDTDLVYKKTLHVTIPAGDSNYSDKKDPTVIAASFLDNAGYESKVREAIVIDDKKPVVTVEWGKGEESPDGKHFRTDRTAAICVKDRNFDEKGVKWKIRNRTGVEIGRWTHSGDQHTCHVSFTKDGDDFLLDFDVRDLAGNTASCPGQQPFCIDKTPPVLRISFDNNHVMNGKYYNKARMAILTVEDKSFRASDVKCSIWSMDGGKRKNGSLSGNWTGNGEIHRNTVDCTEDGEYRIRLACTDLAGNPAVAAVSESFIIDRTPPEVLVTGVKDQASYNDVVAPVVRYTDKNLDSETVHIRLTGSKNGRTYSRWEKTEDLPDGKRIRWKDFRRTQSADDIYTLEVRVMDKAGNYNRSGETVFTVNRFGSDYRFSEETQERLGEEGSYSVSPFPLEVTEINVSRLKEIRVTVKNENNEIITLKEGPDYSVTRRLDRYGFYQYTYFIKKDNFANEGDYSVTISSLDEASNRMTNVTKGRQIHFVIDQTRPYGTITGLEERRYREDRHEITLRADDNYALKEAVLLINGEEIRTYAPEDFSGNTGITEMLKGRKTVQRVSLRLTDQAGNTRTILPQGNSGGCLITSDRFVQLYHDLPMMFVLVSGLVLLILTGIFFGLYKSGLYKSKVHQYKTLRYFRK